MANGQNNQSGQRMSRGIKPRLCPLTNNYSTPGTFWGGILKRITNKNFDDCKIPYTTKMNTEQNVKGLNVSPAIAKPMPEAVWGEIGCFVKMRGSRNKHQVILDEHVGNHLPNCVTVVELCSGEKTNTTWSRLSDWSKK